MLPFMGVTGPRGVLTLLLELDPDGHPPELEDALPPPPPPLPPAIAPLIMMNAARPMSAMPAELSAAKRFLSLAAIAGSWPPAALSSQRRAAASRLGPPSPIAIGH